MLRGSVAQRGFRFALIAAFSIGLQVATSAALAGGCDSGVGCDHQDVTATELGVGGSSGGFHCTSGFYCSLPTLVSVTYSMDDPDPECDLFTESCVMQAEITVDYDRNDQNPCGSGLAGAIYLPDVVCGGEQSTDDAITIDGERVLFTVKEGIATCTDSTAHALRAHTCQGLAFLGCNRSVDFPLDFVGSAASGCLVPPPKTYGCGGGDAGAGMCCTGPAAASAPDGSAPGFPLQGTNARLVYQAGGVGAPGTPGAATWREPLGRYWSHEFAERIVLDPVTQDESHVWMLTKDAIFIEFVDGDSDDVYEVVNPSDEQRVLSFSSGSGEWTFTGLDGTVQRFNADGTWKDTTDRLGNTTTATYSSGVLSQVDFPDGRYETFEYYEAPDPAEGKLHEVTQFGIDGTSTRTWTYSWDDHDLVGVEYPDGTAREFSYTSHPGYMTLMKLVGADGTSERFEAGWEYTTEKRIYRTWKGKSTWGAPGPTDTAVEQLQYSYDDPSEPTEIQVTDAFGNITIYTIGYETGGTKPRLEEVEGDCPSCGDPNRTYEYQTPSTVAGYSLRPSAMIDGKDTRTEYTYNTAGSLTEIEEAVGISGLARTTYHEYDSTYPGLRSSTKVTSTSGTGFRETEWVYGSLTGELEEMTISGAEETYDSDGNGTADGTFSLTTEYTYNSAGQVVTINPPSISGDPADTTTFLYTDTDWGAYLPSGRTDPEIGATPTSFAYDVFGHRVTVTDPNGVVTETEYEVGPLPEEPILDRVHKVIQRGATSPGDDLVTEYLYNTFGDLEMVIAPLGNATVYEYDVAGRLVSVEKKADALSTTHNEMTLYGLHDGGQRIREDLQLRVSGAWVTKAATEYVYTSRCHVDQVIRDADSLTPLVTEYQYDCNGNLENVWDANHPSSSQTAAPTTTYEYDELDRLTTVLQPWAGSPDCRTSSTNCTVTAYEYDVQDHLTSVTDAEGNETTYEYGDRDLLTEEVSPVSGTMTHRYNAHGMLWKTWKGHTTPIESTRSYDGLDRLILEDYPDLDTTYLYDDVGSCGSTSDFEIGRLSSITRGSSTIDYCYDRFGRMTQDGDLEYQYDKNGNVTVIEYPGGVTATYTFDHADRQDSLEVDDGGGAQTVVSAASYLPSGPLSSLTFGSGLATEARVFTGAYYPEEIVVTDSTSTLLDWTYGTDGVGNITSIDDATVANDDRSFGYKDVQYFLTEADGPWGTLDWVDGLGVGYDRIGNRQREIRDGGSAVQYTYAANGASGNLPLLESVDARTYGYDDLGNMDARSDAPNVPFIFEYYDNGRLKKMKRGKPRVVTLTYDGRGFLSTSWYPEPTNPSYGLAAAPTYSTAGVLHHVHREQIGFAIVPSDHYVFYLAGRPVATFESGWIIPDTLRLIVTDHLGTPVMALDDSTAAVLWEGGFEPFGVDYAGAEADDVFFSLPGQWLDPSWRGTVTSGGIEAPFVYNVHRWYEPGTGRYTRPDPLGLIADINLYRYAASNPIMNLDLMGLDFTNLTDAPLCIRIGDQWKVVAPRTREVGDVDGVVAPRGTKWTYGDARNEVFKYVECFDAIAVKNPGGARPESGTARAGSIEVRLELKSPEEIEQIPDVKKRLGCKCAPNLSQRLIGGATNPWGSVSPSCP